MCSSDLLKHRGERLYELARRGEEVERAARRVVIYRLHIVRVVPDDPYRLRFGTRVLFDVDCSRGTYIRTLCADIGERLGTLAHLSFLVRTGVGPFNLADSLTLEEVSGRLQAGTLELLPVEQAFSHLGAVRVAPAAEGLVCHGQPVPREWVVDGPGGEGGAVVRINSHTGRFLAVGMWQDGWLRPLRVFVSGGSGGGD